MVKCGKTEGTVILKLELYCLSKQFKSIKSLFIVLFFHIGFSGDVCVCVNSSMIKIFTSGNLYLFVYFIARKMSKFVCRMLIL